MLLVKGSNNNLAESLTRLLQALIISERIGNPLVVDWPDLPQDRIMLNHRYDSNRQDVTNALIYTDRLYPAETNRYLVFYYYQKLFSQVLIIRQPTRLPYAHKRIAIWGNQGLEKMDSVNRHHASRLKHFYLFTPEQDKETLPILPQTPGVVPPQQIHRIGDVVENWENLLFLLACHTIVAPNTTFINVVMQSTMNKEYLES